MINGSGRERISLLFCYCLNDILKLMKTMKRRRWRRRRAFGTRQLLAMMEISSAHVVFAVVSVVVNDEDDLRTGTGRRDESENIAQTISIKKTEAIAKRCVGNLCWFSLLFSILCNDAAGKFVVEAIEIYATWIARWVCMCVCMCVVCGMCYVRALVVVWVTFMAVCMITFVA